jgi:hypothetical protein
MTEQEKAIDIPADPLTCGNQGILISNPSVTHSAQAFEALSFKPSP